MEKQDGNGRVTRLLASYPLLKLGYPPVSVSRKDSAAYYQAINQVKQPANPSNRTFTLAIASPTTAITVQ